nr:Peptidase S8 S53 domain containing protein [Haemonchus contortus]
MSHPWRRSFADLTCALLVLPYAQPIPNLTRLMQLTTDGSRKIIDCIDCSGAGDVDTSIVKSSVGSVVVGLTGRLLKIPRTWKNPTGKWHLGIKPIYELYPRSLRKIVKEDWQRESWESPQQLAKADALRQLLEHEDIVGGYSDKDADKHDRENLACQVDFLRSIDKLEDKGPVADCIVWHDGEQWKACIDTSFRGRLSLCHEMGDFRRTGQYNKLSERDVANYTVRIAPSGNRLEICLPNGAHGSHVANIAAANFPDAPEQNGLAPGAKIISMMISDIRINSMETGTSLIRAFNLCVEMKVDIVNMSFGEGTNFPDRGRVIDELKRIIEEHDIVFVASAGNNGPALSTVGSPGGTTSGVLGIAARISPKQAATLYGVFKGVKSSLYPWSSRGPSVDGALGVSLYAPGAAIAGVPRYTRRSMEMMNGTSMSSPNAMGAIACMLSKLRADNIPWTPYRVRIALENTAARSVSEEAFGGGHGLVQVLNGYEYFRLNKDVFPPTFITGIDVRVKQSNRSSRGIYIRELLESRKLQEYIITVEPKFKQFSDNIGKSDFAIKISLRSDSEFLEFPRTLFLNAGESSFAVKVDPTFLSSGECCYTEIVGVSGDHLDLGPLFRVPITVISPEEVSIDDDHTYEREFEALPGEANRFFIAVPSCANVCEIFLENVTRSSLKERFILHCLQIIDEKCFRNSETYKNLGPDSYEWRHFVSVVENRTLEICLVRSWTRGPEGITVRLFTRFHGVKRDPNINLVHGSPYTPIRIEAAPFRPVNIRPTIGFTTLHVPFKPMSVKVEPLGPRDLLVRGKQIHRILLTYKLHVSKCCEIRLDLPSVTSYLYESPYDSVLVQLFSSTKEFIGASSSYPERYSFKVEKGEYVAQVEVRHPEPSQLELLADTPLHVRVLITPTLTLDLTSAPLIGENVFKWTNKFLNPAQQVTLYAGSIPDDKLPKSINIVGGSYLTGNFVVMSNSGTKAVDKTAITYTFTEYSGRPPKALSMVILKDKKPHNEEEEMNEAIRDAQISWLTKLKDPLAVHRLYSDLIAMYPDHLPLMLTKLKILADKKGNDVLKFMGSHHWDHSVEHMSMRKDMEERKEAIIDCMLVRAHRIVDGFLRAKKDCPISFRKSLQPVFGVVQHAKAQVDDKQKKSKSDDYMQTEDASTVIEEDSRGFTLEEVKAAYNDLLTWVSPDDVKVLLLVAKYSVACGHLGKAAICLQKLIGDMRGNSKDATVVEGALIEICEILGWIHIAVRLKNDRLVRNRSAYRPF